IDPQVGAPVARATPRPGGPRRAGVRRAARRRRSVTGARTEQRVLALVTLGLVAFGLVMVFSVTSAPAAIGKRPPMTYLVTQSLYAAAGLVLLALLSRFDYHRLRPLAPLLL